MKHLKTLFLLVAMLFAFAANAQVVYSEPAILQQTSQNITIYFDATKGDAGLKDYAGPIYAHIGVITSKSTSGSDWKYAPTWLDNSAKYQLTKVSTNLWKLTMTNINTYFGITDATEVVKQIAIVFRDAVGVKTGRAVGGSDIYMNVYQSGLAVSLSSNISTHVLTDANSSITFTASSTVASDLSIYLNTIDSTPIATASGKTSLAVTYNVPLGDYDVIVKATANGESKMDTIAICHRGAPQQISYSGTLKQGATVNPDGSVTFCIYAPNKSTMMLVGEWDGYKFKSSNLMNYQGNKYFWVTIPAGKLDMNKEYGYYYLVDDQLAVADPYAKLILDPWNDKYINQDATIYPNLKPFPTGKVENTPIAVFKGSADSYDWQVTDFKAPAKENLVIYEMLLRDFTAEKTVKSAMAKLDYLRDLGINAIELMPIMEFNGNNSWGYNPNFYFAPDKAYGTPNDYKQFIDECHKRGIAVILDVVFNHSEGQHPWCKMYWDSTNSRPASDNPFYNVTAPHNWSVFNDFKQEVPEVQNYFCDVLKYWIDAYKVDGYRFDLAKGLGASNSYASDYDAGAYNSSRITIMKKYADAIKSANPNAYTILEYFVATAEENEMGNYGCMSWKKMSNAYQQSAMGFSSNSAFTGMYTGDESRPFGSTVGYAESHDELRLGYKQAQYGSTSVKGNVQVSSQRLGSGAAFMLLVPGAKMIWELGEMGADMAGGNGYTDSQTPCWSYLDNQYRKGLMENYKELNWIRRGNPDLFASNAEFYWTVGTSNWILGRFITMRNANKTKELIVVFNPNTTQKTFTYTFDKPSGQYYINSKTYGTNPTFSATDSYVTVPAHSYVVISNMQDGTSGISSAVADNNDSSLIKVYPNPATDNISIDAENVNFVEIYSLSGALVEKVNNTTNIDITNLDKGSYIVKVNTADGTRAAKLIKR